MSIVRSWEKQRKLRISEPGKDLHLCICRKAGPVLYKSETEGCSLMLPPEAWIGCRSLWKSAAQSWKTQKQPGLKGQSEKNNSVSKWAVHLCQFK